MERSANRIMREAPQRSDPWPVREVRSANIVRHNFGGTSNGYHLYEMWSFPGGQPILLHIVWNAPKRTKSQRIRTDLLRELRFFIGPRLQVLHEMRCCGRSTRRFSRARKASLHAACHASPSDPEQCCSRSTNDEATSRFCAQIILRAGMHPGSGSAGDRSRSHLFGLPRQKSCRGSPAWLQPQ